MKSISLVTICRCEFIRTFGARVSCWHALFNVRKNCTYRGVSGASPRPGASVFVMPPDAAFRDEIVQPRHHL